MKIGIVGTSRYGIVSDDVVQKQIEQSYRDLLQKVGDSNDMEIVYGGGHVPMAYFHYALEKNVPTTQFICNRVKTRPKESQTIIVGKQWGDESVAFLQYIDGLIKIGGGQQSEKEKNQFLQLKPDALFLEYELPLI